MLCVFSHPSVASKEAKKHPPARAVSPAQRKHEGEDHPSVTQANIPPPPVFPEEPMGEEIDHIMCEVFRLIVRFFPSLQSQAHGAKPPPFLWRAIYPQLSNGKPCYNKMGKYCVRLFVGGKWRKVTLFDLFPIENGVLSIASSTNSLELWPTILAKAVYTVYTASG